MGEITYILILIFHIVFNLNTCSVSFIGLFSFKKIYSYLITRCVIYVIIIQSFLCE